MQIGARGTTVRGSFSLKGEKDCKSGQGLQIGARGISNRGRDCDPGHRLQIDVEQPTANRFIFF